jgi:hypothetical protein
MPVRIQPFVFGELFGLGRAARSVSSVPRCFNYRPPSPFASRRGRETQKAVRGGWRVRHPLILNIARYALTSVFPKSVKPRLIVRASVQR